MVGVLRLTQWPPSHTDDSIGEVDRAPLTTATVATDGPCGEGSSTSTHFQERQMLARYSHIRMEAKRKALEGIVSKPAPAPKEPQPSELQRATDRTPERVQ